VFSKRDIHVIPRIRSKEIQMKVDTLPQNVQNLLKVGIFHYGSEDLSTFLRISRLLGYNWIEDDSEPEKRERVLEAINEMLQTDPFHSFETLTQLLKSLLLVGVRWESLPRSVQDPLSRLLSSLSPGDLESLKKQ
jgi:hypothetical protein